MQRREGEPCEKLRSGNGSALAAGVATVMLLRKRTKVGTHGPQRQGMALCDRRAPGAVGGEEPHICIT